MTRETIDFGIDLGSTNSSIALLKGTEVEVIKNNEGQELTPSAVWIDKSGRLLVGRAAKERVESDLENTSSEFKLRMGTETEYLFKRSGRRMKPEELSAEVLKSLKADVQQRVGENLEAAVITVPAAFELPQCEATNKAAKLAGFTLNPLLMEPVAAAMAYGLQAKRDKAFWLVYDLREGTFDAAVIQVRDGVIEVVNHGGDNHLGGKLIDWEIVEQLLIPALTREFTLRDFGRGNPKWIAALAKLKLAAEQARIRVSRDATAEIMIEFLCQDDRGTPVQFEYELKKKDVERLSGPFILRSINICKQVLSEKRLSPGNLEKLLLVGSYTLTPYLRERLADPKGGLGIPLEFSIDPLTVVARGAAVFAGTQRVRGEVPTNPVAGQFVLDLEYKPVGADAEPMVGGKVVSTDTQDYSGFAIEFNNAEAQPPWRSGKVPLNGNGTFMTNLWAEKGRKNTYLIELCDGKGTRRDTSPDRLSYTIGTVNTDPPLIHSVGIAAEDNTVIWLLEKGTPLPARRRVNVRIPNSSPNAHSVFTIRFPIVEGVQQRADRNRLIGFIEIPGGHTGRDLPSGTMIEITVEIDRSRLIRCQAYIPLLDREFHNILRWDGQRRPIAALKHEFELETQRLQVARQKANGLNSPAVEWALTRIHNEGFENILSSLLAPTTPETETAENVERRLLEFRIAIDEIEELIEGAEQRFLCEGLKDLYGSESRGRE